MFSFAIRTTSLKATQGKTRIPKIKEIDFMTMVQSRIGETKKNSLKNEEWRCAGKEINSFICFVSCFPNDNHFLFISRKKNRKLLKFTSASIRLRLPIIKIIIMNKHRISKWQFFKSANRIILIHSSLLNPINTKLIRIPLSHFCCVWLMYWRLAPWD